MRLLIAVAIIITAFTNCKHERFEGQPGLPVQITAHVHGNVIDENGLPIENVTITAGSRTILTDAEGFFYLPQVNLNEQASLVVADKQGYFKGYRVFSASSGTNQVVIKLKKKFLAGTLDASAGGKITLANGAAVTLSSNGVVREQGMSAYNGNVNVYAAYIDPLSNDISETVPGSFLAEDKNGARVHLRSYGMMVVELESPSGEKLQVKPGSTAELRFPIPSALSSTAPVTIPLWYVKDLTGMWKEEGSAARTGNIS